jgi:hypothetical protein
MGIRDVLGHKFMALNATRKVMTRVQEDDAHM